jgi:sporulation protein YlmC with PRC-barrel domain
MTPRVLSAHSLKSDPVRNRDGERIGDLEELMIDLDTGRVSYAVVSFGGLLGIGDKYFAMPWRMLHVDTDEHQIVLDVSKEALEDAPGFDKGDWPESPQWWATVDSHWEGFVVTTTG